MKKSKHMHNHKSLLKRIRVLTNATTIVSVIIMTVVMLGVFGYGFMTVGKTLSEYYADRIEEIVSRSSFDKNGLIKIDNYGKLDKEIMKLHQTVPYLTIEVIANNQLIYREFGNMFFLDQIKKEIKENFEEEIKEEIKENISQDIAFDIPQNYNIRQLATTEGENFGRVSVGIDSKLMAMFYAVLVIVIIPIAIGLMLVMGLFASIVTRPMLRPLSQLTKQLNQLADEEYETIAPSIDINKNRVKEVFELSTATNRLLDKMINYNEVITQSEKMASVGQLTAAITHEINTPLGAINANVNMIKSFAESITEGMTTHDINDIRKQIIDASALSEDACVRIDKIIRSLKLYTRFDQVEFMSVDIHESLNSVIVLTTNLHKNRITIHTLYDEIPEVTCHIGLINQVFMNIFINAIQSIENKGEIIIATSCDDKNVFISFKDTGCGIDVKNIYNIFQYGFTTKQPGSGSGIGLALSNNIIKKHNGSISVESAEGVGSIFVVKIPIKQDFNA